MQAIVEACRRGEVPGEVVRVVSTTAGTPALERAEALGVGALHLEPGQASVEELDARLIEVFRDVDADTIALAGFMRKVGPGFLRAFSGRVLNIHAALLPCFGGQGFYGRRVGPRGGEKTRPKR